MFNFSSYDSIVKDIYLCTEIMTATLTYTLVLAAIYLGRKALDLVDED